MLSLLFLDGLIEGANELNFVIRILVFSYFLFWLYITFQEAQLLFGLSGAFLGYLVFLHGVSITILAVFVIFFLMYGMQFQQVIQFGLMPLFGYHQQGTSLIKMPSEEEQRKQQQAAQIIQQKMQNGTATQQEIQWFSQTQGIQQSDGNQPDYGQMQRLRSR